nr:uricase-2 isozyme 1 [Tanacetum cinerariifolium]
MVYVKAKECSEEVSVEEFAIILAKHFTTFYQQIVEKPWERISIDGQPHDHGFKLGSERRTTEVILNKNGALRVTSGVDGLALLKTTQSGFEGFIRDQNTILPETRERMLATEVSASWRYCFESLSSISNKSLGFTEKYLNVKKVLVDTFFGPPKEGVYSPSVQATLNYMAKAVLGRPEDIKDMQPTYPEYEEEYDDDAGELVIEQDFQSQCDWCKKEIDWYQRVCNGSFPNENLWIYKCHECTKGLWLS